MSTSAAYDSSASHTRRRRHGGASTALLVCGVVVCLGGLGWVWRDGEESRAGVAVVENSSDDSGAIVRRTPEARIRLHPPLEPSVSPLPSATTSVEAEPTAAASETEPSSEPAAPATAEPAGTPDTVFDRVHAPNGALLSEVPLVDGVRHGEWKAWFPSGALQEEGHYENGERSGTWTTRYEDGTVRDEGEFLAGKPHGDWITYHPDGTRHLDVVFDQGQRRQLREYGTTGSPVSDISFQGNKRHGRCTYWTESGDVDFERSGLYEEGVKVAELD